MHEITLEDKKELQDLAEYLVALVRENKTKQNI